MFRHNNQLILKTTRDCNLRCEYCYIKNKDHFKGEMIEYNLYKTTIDRMVDERLSNKQPISIIFHGGEPTLTPKPQFIKMVTYAENQFRKHGIHYSFGMQSNLTLIDEEWCQILSKYNISLGCSFDGVGDSMDKRTTIKQQSFYDKFDMLKKYNVSFGFLMVIHEGNINNVMESYQFLRNNYEIENIKVNYVEDINGLGGEVNGSEFFTKAWKPFLDDYINEDTPYQLPEGNCQHLLSKFVSDYVMNSEISEKSNCGSKICGGGMSIVEMEANGDFQLCGRYSGNSPEAYIMNVNDKDLFSLKQLRKYLYFINEKHKVILDVGCDTCLADGICDHGCMAFYYSKFGKWGIRTDLTCDIHKDFYDYCVQHISELLRAVHKEIQRNGEAKYMLANRAINIKSNNTPYIKTLSKKYGLMLELDPMNDRSLLIKDINKV